jgi:DNA polymerase III subunit epsilon
LSFLSKLFDAFSASVTVTIEEQEPTAAGVAPTPRREKPSVSAKDIQFTVVDLETTGFCGKTDRVLEVALLRLDADGNVLGEFETLVNPMRDIGNSFVHGIEAKHVANAPQFGDIAGDVLELMTGSVLVAHNAPFELKMLCGEFDRLNFPFPKCSWICTMNRAHKYASGNCRKLDAICSELGVPLDQAHCAMSDARATAELLKRCLRSAEEDLSCWAFDVQVNPFSTGCRCLHRSEARTSCSRKPLMDRLTSSLPAHPTDGHLDSYFETLDRVFADSILEELEVVELAELAAELGMNQRQVEAAHRTYLAELTAVAEKDGYISEMEREHLGAIGEALGIEDANLKGLDSLNLYPRDLSGKVVCITGTPRGTLNGQRVTKKVMAAKAEEAGMTATDRLTKKVDLLVARDTYTNSGKGRKAKNYGIPIVSEQVFWNWLGVQVQ